MWNDLTQAIAYGFNKPEDGFCWTTHEFGIKVPLQSALLLSFQTYSRHNHVLNCFAEHRGAACFRLRDGAQAIRLENDGPDEQVFHFQVEPKISIATDVRDLGILVLQIEIAALNLDRRNARVDEHLLSPEPSDFRPRKRIDGASVLATALLRSFVDQGWFRTLIVQVTDDRFVLELALYPPVTSVREIDHVSLRINGETSLTVPVEQPADPSRYKFQGLPGHPYRGILDCSEIYRDSKDRLDIELEWDDASQFRGQSEHWRGYGRYPFPDQSNIYRVSGNTSRRSFAFTGATWLVKLERIAGRLVGPDFGGGRILDWGCGCARILRFFPEHLTSRLHGVDIDAVNIDWCVNHFSDIAFTQTQSRPPMPFADGYFNLVYGHSVFTHLGEEDQMAWLAELARVLSPGGYLLVTVLAELSWFARFYPDRRTPDSVASYLDRGFCDDGWLNVGVDASSVGSYRTVSHTINYIRQHWARDFEVLDWIPGFADLQTLVVLRRR